MTMWATLPSDEAASLWCRGRRRPLMTKDPSQLDRFVEDAWLVQAPTLPLDSEHVDVDEKAHDVVTTVVGREAPSVFGP